MVEGIQFDHSTLECLQILNYNYRLRNYIFNCVFRLGLQELYRFPYLKYLENILVVPELNNIIIEMFTFEFLFISIFGYISLMRSIVLRLKRKTFVK